MKKILIFTLLLTAVQIYSQQGNSCNDPIEIFAGIHFVDGINGEAINLNCTELDYDNGDNFKWYSYTPNQEYLITISTDLDENNGLDTRFHVYKGDCGGLSCVGGNDDVNSSYLSEGSFYAYSNTTYFIAWDGRWGDEYFNFTLEENDPPPPPPFEFDQIEINNSGTGRGLVDMNSDGLDDIVSIQASNINIFIQKPEGGFEEVNISTEQANHTPGWSMAAGDFDRNGYNDLLYGGGNGVTFMKANDDGTGFSEISGNEYVFSQRSNFIDINNDGHLDAFVCHDVEPNVYYINDGNGNLQFFQGPNDEGISSGVGGVAQNLADWNTSAQEGGNYGSVWIDYDNDRDIDLFIAKCRGGDIQWKHNELWRNNGDGTFSNVADITGWYNSFYPDGGHDNSSNLGDPVQTWSSAWGDFNNDGYMDVYVGASGDLDGSHKLMKNNGDGTFTDVTTGSGVEDAPYGWYNFDGDFNNDGLIDILSNGRILLNQGGFKFAIYDGNIPGSGAIGDANNDGFLDIFDGNNLYQNSKNDNNWLKIITIGTSSNINGIGARIEIASDLGTQVRDVRSGTGFTYMGSLNTYFGLKQDSNINNLTIYWPSGIVDVLNNVNINESLTVIEGQTLSVQSSEINQISVFPNPGVDFIEIKSNNNLEKAIISIFDINGRRVINYKNVANKNLVDISKLSVGEYILRIISSNGNIFSTKILKE